MADLHPGKSTVLWQLVFEGAWPTSVAFLGPDRLAAGNQKGEIYVWSLPPKPEPPAETPSEKKPAGNKDRTAPTLAPAKKLFGHRQGITRLAAMPDGRHLVSASLDRTVKLWDLDATPGESVEVVLDEDTRKAEAKRTRKDDALKQPGVKVETLAPVHSFAGHRDWIQALGVSGDGRRMISGDNSSNCIVWDVAERKEVSRWSGYPWNWIVAAALSPDGRSALVSEYRYKRDDFDMPAAALRIWDVAEKKDTLDLLKIQFPKYNPNDNTYGGGQVWIRFTGAGLITAAYSPDGKFVAVGQGGEIDKGQAHLIDTETGKLVRDIGNHQYGMTDLVFSSNGKHLISVGRDTCVRIHSVEDGKELLVLGSPRGGQFKDWFSAVAVSPDQKRIAAADIAGTVHVWELGPAS